MFCHFFIRKPYDGFVIAINYLMSYKLLQYFTCDLFNCQIGWPLKWTENMLDVLVWIFVSLKLVAINFHKVFVYILKGWGKKNWESDILTLVVWSSYSVSMDMIMMMRYIHCRSLHNIHKHSSESLGFVHWEAGWIDVIGWCLNVRTEMDDMAIVWLSGYLEHQRSLFASHEKIIDVYWLVPVVCPPN